MKILNTHPIHMSKDPYLTRKTASVLILLLLVLRLNPLLAQEASVAFSLQQSIEYALKHNASMKNADLDIQIAQKKIKEVTGSGLPQISLAGDVTYFIEFPTSIIPANALNPMAPADQYLAFQFGLPMSSKAGIEISQLLFSGEYLVGLQASRTYSELSKRARERTEVEIMQQVSKSYYLALINKERIGLLDANIERLEKLLKDTKALNEQGFVEKIDVDRLTVALSNLKTEKQKMISLTDVSLYLLKFQMGYKVNEPIQLTDKLSVDQLLSDMAAEYNYENRPEFKLLSMQKKLNELDLKRYRAGYLPTLVAFGNAAYQGYRADFGDIFFSPLTKRYYPQALVGIQLNVPIFKGLSQTARVQQSRLALEKTSNDLENLKNAVDMEIYSSRTMLTNSIRTLDEQKKNVELATEVARISRIKYEQGVGSNLEVVTAESELKTAQTNYLNTLFEALSAQVDLKKASSTLHTGK